MDRKEKIKSLSDKSKELIASFIVELEEKRGVSLTIEEAYSFLLFAMNGDSFQIKLMRMQMHNCMKSDDELVQMFFDETPMKRIIVLYDIHQNSDEANIENIREHIKEDKKKEKKKKKKHKKD